MLGLAIVLLLIFVAIFAPLIAPKSYRDQDLRKSLQPPSSEAMLGTDQFGRDMLSRLVYGSRASVQVGLAEVPSTVCQTVPPAPSAQPISSVMKSTAYRSGAPPGVDAGAVQPPGAAGGSVRLDP